jgi:hypothetical protein
VIAYPQIPLAAGTSFREFTAYVFDKLDGRHVRAAWTKKRGWDRFGTKERMFDETDPEFGPAKPIFMATLAEPLARVAVDRRWRELVAFVEYWGPGSIAGLDMSGPVMRVDLVDADADGRGLMLPKDYLKAFEGVPQARYLGRHRWTRGFSQRVLLGEVEGITFEGVVGKAGQGSDRIMSKAKTQAWRDAVRAACAHDVAEKLLAS